MTKHIYPLMALLIVMTLQGCATAVVTGAAAGATVLVDRRTTGTVIDDQGIEFKAANAFYNNKEIYDHSHINVTSYNGMVLVTGETTSESLKQEITNVVKNMPKVQRVFNELIIAAPSAMTSRSSDAWITSKLKAKIAAEKGINALDIKVVTEHGVAYLMGLVTRQEADIATNVAAQSAGVQRVVKLFEYIELNQAQ